MLFQDLTAKKIMGKIAKNEASFSNWLVYIDETKFKKMETLLSGIPVLQKSKEIKTELVKTESTCCSKPANATACCTPSKTSNENNGACCAQPGDGSACCDK